MSAEEAQKRAARYLKTAALLLDDGDYESCVSRAYYAMFYVARELLRREEVTPSPLQGLINQFGLRLVKTHDWRKGLGGDGRGQHLRR